MHLLKKFFSLINLQINISNKDKNDNFLNIFVDNPQFDCKTLNLNKTSLLSDNIQGMISRRTGEELFSIAYMQ